MGEIYCNNCKKIIIEDAQDFLKGSKEKYIQCPYCGKIMVNFYYEDEKDDDWEFLE